MAEAAALPVSPVAVPSVEPIAIPVREILPWAVFIALFAVILLFFVGAQQSDVVHELLHDGRHLLAFPCH